MMSIQHVYSSSLDTLKWSRPNTSGNTPGGRDGHSACLIGDSMYIFGGFEDGVRLMLAFLLVP